LCKKIEEESKDMIDFFKNQDERQIYFYLIAIFFVCFLIFNSAFKNGQPTCNRYMINVYLYIGLAILFIGLICYYAEYANLNITFLTSLFSFILTLVLIFVIHYVLPMKNILLNHFLWILLLIGFSIMMYPIVSSPLYQPYINRTIMIVSLIFLIMTIVTYIYPSFFEKTYGKAMIALMISLIVIIIIELIDLIYKSMTKNQNMGVFRVTTYVVIFIFTLLVAYDTTRLKMKAKTCKESSVYEYANYPLESLELILDLINLFLRILSLQRN